MTNATTYDFATMTDPEALQILVNFDVAKWGEPERAASVKMHSSKSRGLKINSIVHHERHDFGDALTAAERKAAKAQLSAADKASLRNQ